MNVMIGKFATREIEVIYNKFSNIPEDELNLIAEFIEKLEESKIGFDPYKSYSNTKSIAKICKDIEDIDFVRFYLCLRLKINLDVNLEEALEVYRDLNSDSCIEFDGYYIYYKHRESVMKQLAEEELLSKLEDAYEVSAMFKDEELADMWIFSTSKKQAAKEYMEEHDWIEILEVEQPEFGFKDSKGYEVYYCYRACDI